MGPIVDIPGSQDDMGEIAREYFPLARRLVHSRRALIGLSPCDLSSPLLPFARRLGRAMADLGDVVGLVLPWAHWMEPPAGKSPTSSPKEGDVLTVNVTRNLSEVTLVRVSTGHIPRTLEQAIPELQQNYSRVLVDLSGMDVLSEQNEISGLLDGVAIVGQAGQVTEMSLGRLRHAISESVLLGVVLVG